MNDLRPWQSSVNTGRFVIPTNCRCNMCEGPLPWRTLGIIAGILGLMLWTFC